MSSIARVSDLCRHEHVAYDPFGDTLRSTGPRASANPWRFSTKYTDQESGWLYYGYRYYAPKLGRWVSTDPLGVRAGPNGYHFVWNTVPNGVDSIGLSDISTVKTKTPVCPCSQQDVDKEGAAMARQAELMMRHFDWVKTGFRLLPDHPKPEHCGFICCNRRTKQVSSTGPSPDYRHRLRDARTGFDVVDTGECDPYRAAKMCKDVFGEDSFNAAMFHSHDIMGDMLPSPGDRQTIHNPAIGFWPIYIGVPGNGAVKVEPIEGPPKTYPVIVTPLDPVGAPIPAQPPQVLR